MFLEDIKKKKKKEQNGVAEKTANKYERKWGSEFSWATRELGDLE